MISYRVFTNSQNIIVNKTGVFVRASPGLAEGLVYGPYVSLPAGSYSVYWKFELPNTSKVGAAGKPAVRLDVTQDAGKVILSEKTLILTDIAKTNGVARIVFSVPPGGAQKIAFRAFSLGNEEFSISLKRQVRNELQEVVFADNGLFEFVEDGPIDPAVAEFIARNLVNLSQVQQWGAKLTVSREGVCASLKGLSVLLRNKEDFQIFGEVFVLNSYDAEMLGNFVVADVGMNVGFASIKFASLKGVTEVHAFEPFKAPFTRALENFALNSKISGKIFPNNFGLYNTNSQNRVGYDENHTIGTSVRGSGTSQEVTIELREASSILRKIITQAKAQGQRFLLKLDCEGSEFPIIENLDNHNLLKDIDVILMEWHKWWDPTKTQRSLIEPLLKNQFLILDRTRDQDPHAGFIIATRLS